MDFVELANSIRIVELAAASRVAAIRELGRATRLDTDGLPLDRLLEAVEEREATAQTVVDPGFAIPHALVDWNGGIRVVLGRSRSGVQYGTPDTDAVHLIVLLVIGHEEKERHLESLALLAEFFGAVEFREQIINARDTNEIRRLINNKAGVTISETRKLPGVPTINTMLAKHAVQLVEPLSAQAILVAVDNVDDLPWSPFLEWPGRLLVVTSRTGDELPVERPETHLIDLPHKTLTRMDRANLGLLIYASNGLLTTDARVVCITGPGTRQLDSLTVISPAPQFEVMFGGKPTRQSARLRPLVILRVVALAIELAEEGRESKKLGTMFVLGDSRQVMRHAKQLVLNPFHGYSRTLRSLLDPSLGETIKEFAQLDGAFIVQADGVVLSAGTYLMPKSSKARLPSGLGTRHQAAASITSHTEAMAIVVSQSTGTVTVFRHGRIIMQLERATSTRS